MFFYSYDRDKNESSGAEQNYREHTLLNLIRIVQYPFKIHLVFEQRSNFSVISAENLVKILYDNLDYSAYDFPLIPSFYPNVKVSIESKENPGLQVADYLLWATNRSVLASQGKYSDWMGILEWDSASTEGKTDSWGSRVVGHGASNYYETSISPIKAYPQHPNLETEHEWEVYELYICAENFVHYFARHGLPVHCEHFGEDCSRISSQLKNTNGLGLEDIRDVARLFLRLFDTYPLHSNYSKDSSEFERLLKMKRFLGLTLRRDYIHSMRICIALVQWRRELKPEFLGKLFRGEACP